MLATTQGMTAGDGVASATNNRIGDQVIARGLKFKVYIENQLDRPNVMYRMFLFKYNTLLYAGGASMQDNEFWEGLTGGGQITNRMLGKVRTRNIKILRSKLVKPTYQANYSILSGPSTGPYVKTDFHEWYIPLKNKKIQYRDGDSVFPTRDGYGFAIVAFDAQNTGLGTHISNCMWQSTFYYKDP